MSTASLNSVELLRSVVLRSADGPAGEWFASRSAAIAAGYDRNAFLAAYAGAGRRLRAFDVRLDDHSSVLVGLLGGGSPSGWTLDRFGRCALLATALNAAPENRYAQIVDEVFRSGDNAEREALLAGLILLPDPACYLATAVEACRSNVETVFAAIACENAYPSVYFSDDGFNQMVLKTVFLGLSLSRVVGLAQRRSDELARMAESYASERRAAGRSVPADLDLILSVSE